MIQRRTTSAHEQRKIAHAESWRRHSFHYSEAARSLQDEDAARKAQAPVPEVRKFHFGPTCRCQGLRAWSGVTAIFAGGDYHHEGFAPEDMQEWEEICGYRGKNGIARRVNFQLGVERRLRESLSHKFGKSPDGSRLLVGIKRSHSGSLSPEFAKIHPGKCALESIPNSYIVFRGDPEHLRAIASGGKVFDDVSCSASLFGSEMPSPRSELTDDRSTESLSIVSVDSLRRVVLSAKQLAAKGSPRASAPPAAPAEAGPGYAIPECNSDDASVISEGREHELRVSPAIKAYINHCEHMWKDPRPTSILCRSRVTKEGFVELELVGRKRLLGESPFDSLASIANAIGVKLQRSSPTRDDDVLAYSPSGQAFCEKRRRRSGVHVFVEMGAQQPQGHGETALPPVVARPLESTNSAEPSAGQKSPTMPALRWGGGSPSRRTKRGQIIPC